MNAEDHELILRPEDYSLLTDLYQLTMTACYAGEGLESKRASFELFVRRLPRGFSYLIAMGLAQALDYLEKLAFSGAQIQALRGMGLFEDVPDRFWSILETGHFSGDVWAVPEGTAVFPNEPILRVEAPLWQAQLVETYLLNTINYQTLVATKAARMRDVAGNEVTLLEFGTRRAYSPQASLWGARAALAAGFDSTSNVLAALRLKSQPSGTMAHSLVMGIGALTGSEDQAFDAFSRYFPNSPLLIDTYDTVEAARRLAQSVKAGKRKVRGVRIDSGDIAALSKEIHALLPNTSIFASGDIDEWKIAQLKAEGAVINGYGVGTKLVTGEPVNGVYKMVEIDGIATMKQSSEKASYPGRKQVFRRYQENGKVECDRLGLVTEDPLPGEEPLLVLVMEKGKMVDDVDSLEMIYKRTSMSVANLPGETRQIENGQPIPLEISESLAQLKKTIEERRKQNA